MLLYISHYIFYVIYITFFVHFTLLVDLHSFVYFTFLFIYTLCKCIFYIIVWIHTFHFLCTFSISCTIRAPVFGRHQFFGTSEHYGKAHGNLLSGWMNYKLYTACCWFPTSSNSLILPSQFSQIRFESYLLNCSKCRILVL